MWQNSESVEREPFVELSSQSSANLESARTFVPGWWLRAFEASMSGARDDSYFSVAGGDFLPKFDSAELALFSLILGEVQRQLLGEKNADSIIVLDWSGLLKLLPVVDAASRERLFRVFEALPQVRFVVRDGNGALSSLPLFAAERWELCDGDSRSSRLILKPGPGTVELLTGYVDGHLDFIRGISGVGRLTEVSCGRFPLVLWTPVWLELSVAEQVVYSRMEAAMQSHGAWLRLDGLVGESLDKITEGVKFPKRSGEMTSPLKDKLRLVGKLGRRLIAHGVIKKEPDTGFMAIEGKRAGASPMLLWQASAERLKSKAECEYFGLASARILRDMTTRDATLIRTVLAAISGENHKFQARLDRVWREIKDIPGCGIRVAPDILIQAHFLFMEWIARSGNASLLPLPAYVLRHPIARHFGKIDDGDLNRRFHEFLRALGKAEDLAATLASTSNSEGIFSIALGEIDSSVIKICEESVKALENRRGLAGDSALTKNENSAPKTLSALPLNRISVNKESVMGEKQDFASQRLRKLAQDELEKMTRLAPESYRSLKEKYIKSLPLDTREILMDVQRRLGSVDFDRHLKVRLVRFMIEDPSSWNSVSSALPV